MPKPGQIWRLVTISTLASWLHGNPRGFRSRAHRIHSSGDYRSPPPHGEHAGLYRYQLERAPDKVRIPHAEKAIIGENLTEALRPTTRVLAVSVSSNHAHIVAELPIDPKQARRIIGEAKRLASKAVRKTMPGRLWAAGGSYEPIKDRDHLAASVTHVRDKQGSGSWSWSFRDRVGDYR